MKGMVSLLSLGLWIGWASSTAFAQPLDIPFSVQSFDPASVSGAEANPDPFAGPSAIAAPKERTLPDPTSELGLPEDSPDAASSLNDTANASDLDKPEASAFSELLQSLFDDFSGTPDHTTLPDMDTLDFSGFEVPIQITPEVTRWMEFFTSRGRGIMLDWLARSNRYVPIIGQEFEAAGLPRELAYVAMIESGFVSHSTSGMGAAGMWQFMPRTARSEGLKVERWVDERRDPIKATRAAARHFEALYNRFDDWYLALAAYNAGGGRISGALDRHRTNNFWTLARRRAVRPETCNYVPRFLAAAIIAENPERFGFYDVPYDQSLQYEVIQVQESTPLALLAAQAGVDAETMRLLNQELIRGSTPPGTYSVKVPPGTRQIYEAQARSEAGQSPRTPTWRQHRVVSGQSLEKLARLYGVSLKAIQELNGFRSTRLQVGDLVLIPGDEAASDLEAVALSTSNPSSPGPALSSANGEVASSTAAASTRAQQSARGAEKKNSRSASSGQTHRVQPGDTLWSISRKYMVSVEELSTFNNLRHPRKALAVGQRLDIPTR